MFFTSYGETKPIERGKVRFELNPKISFGVAYFRPSILEVKWSEIPTTKVCPCTFMHDAYVYSSLICSSSQCGLWNVSSAYIHCMSYICINVY